MKGALRANSAGQPAGSLDEWGGGREERTPPMDVTESGMVFIDLRSAQKAKALCARNSAGQPAGSPDERGGRREELTVAMAVVVSGMVKWPF